MFAALKVRVNLDPRGKSWMYAIKASLAMLFSFVLSAWCYNFDSLAVSSTAYLLGAPDQDARCLGGTVWKAFGRIIGVVLGGVIPAAIHNAVVPASGLVEDCSSSAHVVNSLGTFMWCFVGIHIYKVSGMITTSYGGFGYVGLP